MYLYAYFLRVKINKANEIFYESPPCCTNHIFNRINKVPSESWEILNTYNEDQEKTFPKTFLSCQRRKYCEKKQWHQRKTERANTMKECVTELVGKGRK